MIASVFGFFSIFFALFFHRLLWSHDSNHRILERRSIKHNLYREKIPDVRIPVPNYKPFSPSSVCPVTNLSLFNSRKNFNFHFGLSTTTHFHAWIPSLPLNSVSGLSLRDKFAARYSDWSGFCARHSFRTFRSCACMSVLMQLFILPFILHRYIPSRNSIIASIHPLAHIVNQLSFMLNRRANNNDQMNQWRENIPSKKCSRCSHMQRKPKEEKNNERKSIFWMKVKWKRKNHKILQNKTFIKPFSVQRTRANIESHAKAILPSADYHQSFETK